jgi:hypothetical protein
MFENQRYITNGVSIGISLFLQNILWYMIETMRTQKQDYLQVFTLEKSIVNSETRQKIIHTQEEPDYCYEYSFKCEEPIATKIFVIDDETHTTMLLAEEY